MKKFLCILLAALLCLPLLVACGKKDETPADNTQTASDGAAQQAAAQQADKSAIAEAVNGVFSFDALKSLLQSQAGDGENPEQGEAQGETPAAFMPMAMVESLLATVETIMNTPDERGNKPAAEVKFDTVFFSPVSVLFSLQNGVLYGNVNGEVGWIALNDGKITLTTGLPLATEEQDLQTMILGNIENEMIRGMIASADNAAVTEEQLQAVIDMLPALTAADLIPAGNGVYVLTDDYITRFSIAVMNITSAQTMPAGDVPAEAVAQQAAAAAAMQEQIAQMVTALGIKIGFKLTGTTITSFSLDFEATEATVAAVNTAVANIMEINQVPASNMENGLKAGMRLHLALTLNADQLPTALDLALTVPDDIDLSVKFEAAYANKAVTNLKCDARVTLFANAVDGADVYEYDEDDYIMKQAEILADTTVVATLTFDSAKLALDATGEPLNIKLSVTYANIQRLFDGEPVENFEGVKFADKDAKMEDPQNASFKLTSVNNGQGLIRFVATTKVGDQDAEIGALDVRIGSAPNFVTPEASPYAELSAVVEKLFETESNCHGNFACTIGDNTYYFWAEVSIDDAQNQQGEITTEKHTSAEFIACLPNDAPDEDKPFQTYILLTLSNGQLVGTPVFKLP